MYRVFFIYGKNIIYCHCFGFARNDESPDNVVEMIRSHWKYLPETIPLFAVLGLFRLLPVTWASWLGGRCLRLVGPRTRRHRVALDNLALAFPEKSAAERERIARDMWEHLGRVFAELPSLPGDKLTRHITQIKGREHIPEPHGAILCVSAHLGQWELLSPVAQSLGIPTAALYRHINNPWLDRYLLRLRRLYNRGMIRKGREAPVAIIKALRQNTSLAIMVDQKLTGGLELPFFGHPAKTAPTPARLALKTGCPILPSFIIRERGVRFTAHILPPIRYDPTGNTEADIRAITMAINEVVEDWVRRYPEQWLWVHKRWGSLKPETGSWKRTSSKSPFL